MDSLGHTWGDWVTTQEPTTTSTGQQRRVCKVCGELRTQTIQKLPSGSGTTASATELINFINAERAKKGLSALSVNSTLSNYAATRSQKYAAEKKLVSSEQYIRTELMKSYGTKYGGEYFEFGYPTAEMAFNEFYMTNTAAKNAILNSNFKYIGASCYTSNNVVYWVVDLAG